MNFEIQTKMLLNFAAEFPDGFTVNIAFWEVVTSGIAVAYRDTQNCFGFGGAYFSYQHALFNSGFVGGWKNENGLFQFDSVRMFTDLQKAIKWGRKQNQRAIFDIDNGWEINL